MSARGGRCGYTLKVTGLQVRAGGRQDPTWTVIQAWGERHGQQEASSSWPVIAGDEATGPRCSLRPEEAEGCWAVASGKGRMARQEETPRAWEEGTE